MAVRDGNMPYVKAICLIQLPLAFIPNIWDYKINLKLETVLKFFPIYKLMETENLALREFIKENLKKGYI